MVEGGFLTNSHGIAVIASVDDIGLPVAQAMEERLQRRLRGRPMDLI